MVLFPSLLGVVLLLTSYPHPAIMTWYMVAIFHASSTSRSSSVLSPVSQLPTIRDLHFVTVVHKPSKLLISWLLRSQTGCRELDELASSRVGCSMSSLL